MSHNSEKDVATWTVTFAMAKSRASVAWPLSFDDDPWTSSTALFVLLSSLSVLSTASLTVRAVQYNTF